MSPSPPNVGEHPQRVQALALVELRVNPAPQGLAKQVVLHYVITRYGSGVDLAASSACAGVTPGPLKKCAATLGC